MTNQLSHQLSVLTLNGAKVEGLSDDDVPVELPKIVLAEVKRGRDGTMYSYGTAAKGGEVMVKLLPTSTTGKDWLRKHAEIQSGTKVKWEGSWEDSDLGFSSALRGGVMTECPSGVVPGQNLEFKFEFEEIVPEMDGANFEPSPV